MPRTPTPMQKKAAKAVVENLKRNNPLPTGQVLEKVGYGTITKDPQRITESLGYKQAIRDMGLTEELITSSLVKDIKKKPKNRLGELRLGAEILGMKEDEDKPKEKSGNTYNIFFSKEIQEDVKLLEDKIKEKLKQNVQTLTQDN